MKIIKDKRETVKINAYYPEHSAKLFNELMRWDSLPERLDFSDLMEVVSEIEKFGYVVCIDFEVTYLHYPMSAKKSMQSFKNKPKIDAVYRACLVALRHLYNFD